MCRHPKKSRFWLVMKCGVDFKSNLTNGSRNVLGVHGRQATRLLSKLVIYKKIILGRFPTLSTFLSTREKSQHKKVHPPPLPTQTKPASVFLIPPFAFLNFSSSPTSVYFLMRRDCAIFFPNVFERLGARERKELALWVRTEMKSPRGKKIQRNHSKAEI